MSLDYREGYKSALQEAKEQIEAHAVAARKEMEVRLFVHSELVPALKEAESKAREKCKR